MFLRNAWYMAAWAAEVGATPLTRRLLDEPVVLYRKQNGEAVALHDRCPHRFAPLSMGRIHGDTLECGYHGLRFGADGKCVLNPHGNCHIPENARVRSFPVMEKNTILWIWMGEPALVDTTKIPNYDFLDDPKRARVDGYLHVHANYQLETDNLLDLSHTQFVHDNFHFSQAILGGHHEVKQEGSAVHSNLWCPDGEPSPNFARRMPSLRAGEKVDQWFDMRWEPPCNLRLDTGVTPAGRKREEGAASMTAHVLTPETEQSTHYFFGHSRCFRVDDEEMDAEIAEWQRVGFGVQDRGMLQAVQQRMGTSDLMSLKPILLPIDAAAMRARRVLAALLEVEKKSTASAMIAAVR